MKNLSILTVIFCLIVGLVGCGQKDEEVKQTSNVTQKQEVAQISKPVSESEKIVLSNVTVKGHDGITDVLGEVKNNDSKKHTFTIRVTFYDSNKKILGTAVGTVNDLEAGKTKTFQAGGIEDYSKASSNKVEVDTIVE